MTTLEEIERFEDWFSSCFPNEDLSVEETLIKLKKFVLFFTAQNEKVIELIQDIERCQITQIATTIFKEEKAKNKRIKRFLRKRFFKDFPYFKEVPERKGCDAILMKNEEDLKNYHVFLNDDTNKEITEAQESSLFRIIFLKNTNPRDSKKTTYGFIKQTQPSKD